MSSLRRRLILPLLGVLVLWGALAACATYLSAMSEIKVGYDIRLRDIANVLDVATLPRRATVLDDPNSDDDVIVQLWNLQGALLFNSSVEDQAPFPGAVEGYQQIDTAHDVWNSYSRVVADHIIQVAQSNSARRDLAALAALRVLMPFIAALPVLGLLIWIILTRGLAPLKRLAAELRGRPPQSLHAVRGQGYSSEVQPLVDALNGLLHQQAEARAVQQTFIADAAHELRTPITAVRLQAQIAQRAEDAEERAAALSTLLAGADRAGRMVQQLLALVRQEPTALMPRKRLRLDVLLRDALAGLAPLAQAKSIEMVLLADEPVQLTADAEGLRALIGNLAENAIRHTPNGGSVTVSLRTEDAAVSLVVADTGPGIPSEEREQVFQRFYRAPSALGIGSGLGLAIAGEVVRNHGGTIALEDAVDGGLIVRVLLPAVDADA